jgi:hypothetical protein
VESLAKKYDEKYRAAADVNTQLAAGEAAYREIQVVFVYDGKKIICLRKKSSFLPICSIFF